MKNAIRSSFVAGLLLLCGGAIAQPDMPSKVSVAWNQYYSYDQVTAIMRDIAKAYPEITELRSIGKSLDGRDLWLLIISNPKTGNHKDKPAMWIDGSIHANELQATEVVLYTAWYLTKAYGQNKPITELLDRSSFYLLPLMNPDSRVAWFETPSTPHSQRQNTRPIDDDRDGRNGEDPDDDLDGDGSITMMWKEDPNGRWERDKVDPRIFRRVAPDKPAGGWTMLGEEGIDNDGDGRINEDGPGGDDMNRNWAAGWLPPYVQFGAGSYPFSAPETRAVRDFLLDHPNVAAVQSYHNTGGMILRGPGAPFREWAYPREDVAVYDRIATVGEKMLPYYRSMVIHKDLYTVHGGLVNYTAESLGIFSFTNELWSVGKYFQRDGQNPNEEMQWLWRDKMAFGQLFKDYTEVEHPTHGRVLVGGPNKWSSRVTPTFMLEEECHRNFAFTVYHADEMPLLSFARTSVSRDPSGLWAITVQVSNDRAIPTRSVHARNKGIGRADLFTVEPASAVKAAAQLSSWIDRGMDFVLHEPARVRVESGVPGKSQGGSIFYRFLVEGAQGQKVRLTYSAEKAAAISVEVTLEESK